MGVNLEQRITRLRELHLAVKSKEAELAKLKKAYERQEGGIMKAMERQGLEIAGSLGKGKRVRISEQEHLSIGDYAAFARYVLRNRAVELLQKRVAKRAVEERWAEGKKVPGIKVFTQKKLRWT